MTDDHNSASLRVTNKFVPVAPTTVKVVSRYKSNFSATIKPVGALIERSRSPPPVFSGSLDFSFPLWGRLISADSSVSARTKSVYQTCRGDQWSSEIQRKAT